MTTTTLHFQHWSTESVHPRSIPCTLEPCHSLPLPLLPRMRSQHQRGFHPRPTRARRRFDSRPSPLFLLLIVFVLFNFCTRVYAGKDYYDILGVSRDADVATIKKAFRKLAVKYHPDKNPGDKEAEQKYVELNNAYEVLGDDSKRQKYDMFGEDGLSNGENDDVDNDFNPFGDFFGRRRRRRQERRVQDVIVPLSVSLEMLYNGGVIEAAHKKRVICSSWSDCERKCSRCGGQGVVIQTRRLGPGFVQQIQTACPVCSGTGKISNPNCKSCPNGQFEQIEKQLLIDVESGMADGQMITFEGETDEVPDYHTGNVRFEIDTQLHDRFERKGDNLHYKLTITLSEALVGVNRIVRQLDGRQVAIKTDSVITPGDNIVIKGEGMPVYDTVDAGDMIVDFWVKFPESLSDEQKEAAIALHGEIPTLKETGDGVRNSSSHTNEEKTEL